MLMSNLQISRRDLAAVVGTACAMPALLGRAEAQTGAQTGAVASDSSLPRPSQAPILTISGRIGRMNQGNTAVFDRPMLDGLGTASFTTVTPWFDGPVRFDGVLMTKLLQTVGATGSTVTALALNDYSTDIPIADFARFGVILATLRNGQPMRVSDKGPLFIVYPYDSNPELKNRLYYSRSAWSVAQLIVR
jgi:hypothetical protein